MRMFALDRPLCSAGLILMLAVVPGVRGRAQAAEPAPAGAPSPVPAPNPQPTGYGKAQFGQSLDEVRALYPKMEELTENLGAAVVEGKFISRQVLRAQRIPGLGSPVDVELRFWKNQLWVVIIYFGGNDLASVVQSLTDLYGPPKGKPESAVWMGSRATIIVAGKARWYSMHDNVISKDAQAVFMEDFRKTMERRKARKASTLPVTRGPSAAPTRAAQP